MPRLEEECEEQLKSPAASVASANLSETGKSPPENTCASSTESKYSTSSIESRCTTSTIESKCTTIDPVINIQQTGLNQSDTEAAMAATNQLSVPDHFLSELSPDITADGPDAHQIQTSSPDLLRVDSLQASLRASSMPPLTSDSEATSDDAPPELHKQKSHEQHDDHPPHRHQNKIFGRFSSNEELLNR